jgi:hypothetical protein
MTQTVSTSLFNHSSEATPQLSIVSISWFDARTHLTPFFLFLYRIVVVYRIESLCISASLIPRRQYASAQKKRRAEYSSFLLSSSDVLIISRKPNEYVDRKRLSERFFYRESTSTLVQIVLLMIQHHFHLHITPFSTTEATAPFRAPFHQAIAAQWECMGACLKQQQQQQRPANRCIMPDDGLHRKGTMVSALPDVLEWPALVLPDSFSAPLNALLFLHGRSNQQ